MQKFPIKFEKWHGLGNDFVIIDASHLKSKFKNALPTKAWVKSISNRKTGVGFDQLLIIDQKRFILHIYNTDGSRAEMCGNGLRAAALYYWRHHSHSKKSISMRTDAGQRLATLTDEAQSEIECEMGNPCVNRMKTDRIKTFQELARKHQIKNIDWDLGVFTVDVGNPHLVVFMSFESNLEKDTNFIKFASLIEKHKYFKNRTNVEFVKIKSNILLNVVVWERGVGFTKACGTGAVASAIAAIQTRKINSKKEIKVKFKGGQAKVSYNQKTKKAFLTGTAKFVFSGEI